jgi:hypothetical protein
VGDGLDSPRCGSSFRGETDPKEGAHWVIGEGAMVVCPDWATAVDLMWQGLDWMGVV